MPPDDDDFLDGCEIDFTAYAEDDETSALRPLFPNVTPETDPAEVEAAAAAWRALGGAT